MHRREFVSLASRGLCLGGLTSAIGCGTLLHPERHGQPHSRDIDWSVVALDGLGLILFFVPGVIAFVVDFSTGAIYLPPKPEVVYPVYVPGPYPEPIPSAVPSPAPPSLSRIAVPRTDLNQREIERVVSAHCQQPISVVDANTRASELPDLAQYDQQCRRHRTDAAYGWNPGPLFAETPGA